MKRRETQKTRKMNQHSFDITRREMVYLKDRDSASFEVPVHYNGGWSGQEKSLEWWTDRFMEFNKFIDKLRNNNEPTAQDSRI